MIHYSEPLFRPPSEGNNLILQVTHGCSYNKCTFCSMYRTKKYEEKSLEEIFKDIDTLSQYYPQTTRVFLADGDALAMHTQTLVSVLNYLHKKFVHLRRVSSYASPLNLELKTLDELICLRENGLKQIYFGIETGSDILLKKIQKGSSFKKMKTGLLKASAANMKISATVILGVGGKQYTQEHIEKTALLVNETKINFLSTLQLGLQQSEQEEFFKKFDYAFEFLDDKEMLKEQLAFLEALNPTNQVIFRSNHASNAFALAGNLPKDKMRLMFELKQALENENSMIPSWLRGF